MFTSEDIQRAHLIAKKTAEVEMRKPASYLDRQAFGGMGKLEGNPNSFNMPWPKYNAPPPTFAKTPEPPSFMQSIGDMGKGMYRTAMGAGAAATIGQKGSHGLVENVLQNAGSGVRSVWSGQGPWGQVPNWVRKPLAPIAGPFYGAMHTPGQFNEPYGRFLDNSQSDRAMAMEPATWAHRNWRDVVNWWNTPNQQ